MNKLNETEEYLIKSLCLKYDKNEFSEKEAKNFMMKDEHFTESDFNTAWQKLYTANREKDYIGLVINKDKFIILHKGLLYKPEPPKKEKFTYSQIISIITICANVSITLFNELPEILEAIAKFL